MRNEQQQRIASELGASLGVDPERVLFPNKKEPLKPWLPPDVLTALARGSGEFQAIDDDFVTFIAPLNQVVHKGTVVDREGRSFSATGVATIGEKVPDTDEEFDEHVLARGRGLGAALDLAGFNPLRGGSATTAKPERIGFANEAELRNNHLGRIHILAVEAGLIKHLPEGGKDMSQYHAFLIENFGVESAAGLSEQDRKSVINALEAMIRNTTAGV
ncbi:MAG: hypothetical protein AABN33_18230 [Acidobacteriota bacterium]